MSNENETMRLLGFVKDYPSRFSNLEICFFAMDAHSIKNVRLRQRYLDMMFELAKKRGIHELVEEAVQVRKNALKNNIQPKTPCCCTSCGATWVAMEFVRERIPA